MFSPSASSSIEPTSRALCGKIGRGETVRGGVSTDLPNPPVGPDAARRLGLPLDVVVTGDQTSSDCRPLADDPPRDPPELVTTESVSCSSELARSELRADEVGLRCWSDGRDSVPNS